MLFTDFDVVSVAYADVVLRDGPAHHDGPAHGPDRLLLPVHVRTAQLPGPRARTPRQRL